MKYQLAVFFILLCSCCHSQAIKSSIVEYTITKNYSKLNEFGKIDEIRDANNIFLIESNYRNVSMFLGVTKLESQKHGVTIHKFDNLRNEVASKELEKGDREFGPFKTMGLEFGNRLLLLYFKYAKNDSMNLYIAEIDKNDLTLKNPQFLYGYIQENIGYPKYETILEANLVPRISPDGSKLLLAFNMKNELFSCVLDNRLNILRKKTSKDLALENAQITEAYIENSGNCEIIPQRIKSTRNNGGIPKLGIIVQHLDNQEKLIEFSTVGENGELRDVHLKNSKDNSKLYIYGDYQQTEQMLGAWVAELESQNFKILSLATFPYPAEMMKNFYKIDFGSRKKDDYSVNYIPFELFEFDNGDIALCGHPSKAERLNYADRNGYSSSYVQTYAGPIVVAFINKAKTTSNFSVIPRHQYLASSSMGVYATYHDNLIVFYNDFAKNLEKEITPDKVHQKEGSPLTPLALAYAIIKKDGGIQERKMIAEGNSTIGSFNTSNAHWTTSNKLLIPASNLNKKKETLTMISITIE